jgi:hypothetical protein
VNTGSWLVALAAIGTFILTLCAVTFGLVVRGTRRWTRLEVSLTYAESALAAHIASSDKAHGVIFDMLKDDRAATNERLLYLERERVRH